MYETSLNPKKFDSGKMRQGQATKLPRAAWTQREQFRV